METLRGLPIRWYNWIRPFDSAVKTLLAVGLAALAILAVSIGAAAIVHSVIGGDVAAWTQAVGAILAIVSGFGVAFYQRREEREDAAIELPAIIQASYVLAFQALETVGERLDNILTRSSVKLSLQGDRTSEMVEAMREFDTSRLPAEMLKDFILLRSHVFAMNKRISEVYEMKVKRGDDIYKVRHDKLESTVMTYRSALQIFGELSGAASVRTASPLVPTTRQCVISYQRHEPLLV